MEGDLIVAEYNLLILAHYKEKALDLQKELRLVIAKADIELDNEEELGYYEL